MSLAEENKKTEDEAVKVEDILANFFLGQIEMKGSRSDSDSKYKKKSKHKKHKSKKSKYKSGRRSLSSEKRTSDSLRIGCSCSSEEKDIKRLKKLKKLDMKDSSKFSSFLPLSLSTQSVLPLNENFVQSEASVSDKIDIPYGPSLELLLMGTETNKGNIESKHNILSFAQMDESPCHPASPVSTSAYSDPKLSGELKESESSKSPKYINDEVNYKERNILNDADMPSNELLNVSKQFLTVTEIKDSIVNSVAIKQESNNVERKKISEKTRSRSRSKPLKRSRSKSHTSQSRSRKRSRSISRNRSRSIARKHSTSRSRKHSRSRSRKLSRSRSRKRSRSRSRKRSRSRSRKHSRSSSRRCSRSRRHSRSWSRKYSQSRSSRHSRSLSRKHLRSRSRKRSTSRSNYTSSKERSYSRDRTKTQYSSQTKARRSRSQNRSWKSRSHSHSHSRSRQNRRSRSWSMDSAKSKHSAKRRSRSVNRSRRSRSHEKEHGSHRSQRESSYNNRSSRKSSYERASKSRKKSRSKSKEKHRAGKSCKIDQAKIRQIAEKNVLNMIQQGTLPEGISLEHFKKKELVSIKAGGKSVQELTDFCAKLSKKENEVNNEPPDIKDINNLEGENDFIHHPFKLKEQSVIKLNIKNAVQIPIKTHAEKFAETAKLSSQFPVSSGNQHKQKELEWVPVVPQKSKSDQKPNEIKSIVPVESEASVAKSVAPKTAESATLMSDDIPSIPLPSTPNQPLPPSLPPLPTPPPPPFQLLSSSAAVQTKVSAPVINIASTQSVSYPTLPVSNTLPVATYYSAQTASAEVSRPIFKPQSGSTSTAQFDFPSVFSKKFHAEQKLHEDPNNAEALKAIHEAETAIQDWVNSCKVPGMFYGSTHVKPLSRDQLGGFKDYRVKKDTLIRAAPVTEGKGMSLLKKMGWNPGEGLGKNKEGALVPLILDIKMDKKGLVSEGESGKNNLTSAVKELQGKHPVSALMELCSKRKWKPPLYTIIKDSGPPHKKQFVFKVEVNGTDYQPVMPSSNKKIAKADAAIVCLQALKVFPA